MKAHRGKNWGLRPLPALVLALVSGLLAPSAAAQVISATVNYSTFLGGASGNPDDGVSHLSIDPEGNLWVTGTTDARDFPTVNAQQPNCALGPLGGCRDVFIAKFDPNGSLLFSTYLGSDGNDESGGIVTDSKGNAFVTGAWDSVAFVAKLDRNGRTLFHRTFPRTPNSYGRGIAIDQQDNIYVTGEVLNLYPQSPSLAWPAGGFLATPRVPSCVAIGGGSFALDAFIVKLGNTGQTLFEVALGGNGNDVGRDIAVDSAGNIWVLGGAGSADFPTKDPLQPNYGGGEGSGQGQCNAGDVFVAKINPTAGLLYSTFLGADFQEQPHAIEVDREGNAYLVWTGGSEALDLLPCPWVTKLNPSGQVPVYSECLQGTEARAVAIDPFGNAYLTGAAGAGMPTVGAFQELLGGGGQDAFVAKLDPNGALRFSSYLGGRGFESGLAVASGSAGDIYLAGVTDSDNFPTRNPAQASCAPDFRGGCSVDGFVTRIGVEATHGQQATVVSAASFAWQQPLAADSIASVFGEDLALLTESASVLPLPYSLAGTSIHISDTAGAFHSAELFYASPSQINFLIPASVALGAAEVWIVRQGEVMARAPLRIDPVAPALFSANASGRGPAAALVVRTGSEPSLTFQCAAPGSCSAFPIDLQGAPVFLTLYGTGMRGRSSLAAVSAQLGGQLPVTFAGPHPSFTGLDQVNIGPLPQTFAGSGEVEITLTVDGIAANRVTVAFR